MSAAKLAKAAIKIPMRIERTNIDILKALSSTVKFQNDGCFDFGARIHDVYFINVDERRSSSFLLELARLSGIDTAKYMLEKHPEIFYRDHSEPKIRAFMPPECFSEVKDLNKEDLKWCIENLDVPNAIIAYNEIKKQKIKLDTKILLDFFELICATNGLKVLTKFDMKRHYLVPNDQNNPKRSKWNNQGLAETLFNKLSKNGNATDISRCYSAMIYGLVFYQENSKAKKLYEQYKVTYPGRPLSPDAYNAILLSLRTLITDKQAAMLELRTIIEDMADCCVPRNLLTYNSILKTCVGYSSTRKDCLNALKLVNGMFSEGIMPSLATYMRLISMILATKFDSEGLIDILLNDIHDNFEEYREIRDLDDVNFFSVLLTKFAKSKDTYEYCIKLEKIYKKDPHLFHHSQHKKAFGQVLADIVSDSNKNDVEETKHNPVESKEIK